MAFTVAAVAPGSPVAPASFAEVAPASFAEVVPDGGAVRASLEADARPFAEVAPRCGAPGRVSKPTTQASISQPHPLLVWGAVIRRSGSPCRRVFCSA